MSFEGSLVSLPIIGLSGISCDKVSDKQAIPAPIIKTALWLIIQTKPKRAGSTTAAMWFMVKLILDVAAIAKIQDT